MPIDMPMNGLRRKNDAMKTDAGIKKTLSTFLFLPLIKLILLQLVCSNNFTVCNDGRHNIFYAA
jgi:hypothetical protein